MCEFIVKTMAYNSLASASGIATGLTRLSGWSDLDPGFVRKNFLLGEVSGIGSNLRMQSYADCIDDEEYHPRRRKEYAHYNAERQAQREMQMQCENVLLIRDHSGGGVAPSLPVGGDPASWTPSPSVIRHDHRRGFRDDGYTYHESHDIHYHFHCCKDECDKPTPDDGKKWGAIDAPRELRPCGGQTRQAAPAPAAASDDIHIDLRDSVQVGGVYIVNKTGDSVSAVTVENPKQQNGRAILSAEIGAKDTKARRLHMTQSVIRAAKLHVSIETVPSGKNAAVENGAYYGAIHLHEVAAALQSSRGKYIPLVLRSTVEHNVHVKGVIKYDGSTQAAVVELILSK